ncbi:unnamed protein product [Rodentolepis nana]|uniref:Beta-lactamase n=1 Tax=Rodentolepis nana TaxID=102285 RepID=A0A0R3TIY9_RODNA|nr:unnamed protein product [Rodentolepis nana]
MKELIVQFLKEQPRDNDLQLKVDDMVIQNEKEYFVDHKNTSHGTVRRMAALCCIGNSE